jgi:hypothetical protein
MSAATVSKETYDAALTAFAEAKEAAASIRIPGWTVYEVVEDGKFRLPTFTFIQQVTESLEAAMSTPLSRYSQYLIVEEVFAADGSRWTTDGLPIVNFSGCNVVGWIRDKISVLLDGPCPECHDRWFRARIGVDADTAEVLDDVLQPADWQDISYHRTSEEIYIFFKAGKEEEEEEEEESECKLCGREDYECYCNVGNNYVSPQASGDIVSEDLWSRRY